jgi:hypothetical protein
MVREGVAPDHGAMSARLALLLLLLLVVSVVAVRDWTGSAGLATADPAVAAQPAAGGAKESRGCLMPDKEDATPVDRAAADPPRQPVPFFARRAGALPADGPVMVGGVSLPAGSACPHHWATDLPTPDAYVHATRLAAAFPETGLWPVVWESEEDPDRMARPDGDLRDAERRGAAAILRHDLAPASDRLTRDPADAFGEAWRGRSASAPAAPWLVLVPVHRPADALTLFSTFLTERFTDPEVTTVARSWEERFGAVLTTVEPSVIGEVFTREPAKGAPARALDFEIRRFAECGLGAGIGDCGSPSSALRSLGWAD